MKIICIGKNYLNHIKEMQSSKPEDPVFFLKPDTALLLNNRPFYYPDFSKNIHFEVELVYKIKKTGKCVEEKFASSFYDEIALGIDFTARDLQKKCKDKGLPWEIAKGFDRSAVLSNFIPISSLTNSEKIEFSLLKNGEKVQQGISTDMIFSINEVISYVSEFMTMKMGDLIYTGTPEGVGPIQIGDKLEGFIEDKKMFSFVVK